MTSIQKLVPILAMTRVPDRSRLHHPFRRPCQRSARVLPLSRLHRCNVSFLPFLLVVNLAWFNLET